MGAAGLFGPHTMTWRVNREGVLLLGGGRALIMQVAHPLVAAGVSQHSNYREDPWGRLYRTIDVTTEIVFGSSEESEAAAGRLWNRHGMVKGETHENGGRYAAGTPYHAHDPDLLMWVHATLVDSSMLVYDRYVHRLSRPERERYYDEQRLLAERFGVPLERQPATLAEFERYLDTVVHDELAVTDTLRDVTDAVLNPVLPWAARPLGLPVFGALNLATIGMLPPKLRADLGLSWGPGRERLLGASHALLRNLLPLVPGPARQFPRARSAQRRLRREPVAA